MNSEAERFAKLPRKEWEYLFDKYPQAIEELERASENAVKSLNELNALVGIKSEVEFRAIKDDLEGWVKNQMLSDKEIAKLSKLVPVENMVVPKPLQEIKESFIKTTILINHSHLGSTNLFRFVKFNGEQWELNRSELDVVIDGWKVFLKSNEQKERLAKAQELANYLNSLGIGFYSKQHFVSALVLVDGAKGEFIPDFDFVFADPNKFKN